MEDTISMRIEGLEELENAFADIVKRYPDKAGELLQEQAKLLRKDVVKKVKNDMDYNAEGKRSLSKISSYDISPVKGYGARQYVEVSAKAPHFHLLENGHQIVLPRSRTIKNKKTGRKRKVTLKSGGKNVGFALGYKIMDRSSRERERAMPDAVESLVEQLFREGGF